ncbi:MAG: cupin domain-containing protein [Thioalkalivibrionaceae bacterium]
MNPRQIPDDTLSSVLRAYSLRAAVDANPILCGRWQFGTSGSGHATFHLLGEGSAFLHLREGEPIPLSAGDLVLMPHDAWHRLAPVDRLVDSEIRMVREGSGPATVFVCGHFEFATGRRNPVIVGLPELIVVREADAGDRHQRLAELMLLEVSQRDTGYGPVIDRLADTLFVMAVRHHLSHAPLGRGLVAALADDHLRRALDAMHSDPGDAWTLDRLAAVALLSRSAFAERFAERVGQTPIEYLTHWRMLLAERRLHEPGMTVALVAGEFGYSTEGAFRKAYRRIHGHAPGRVGRMLANLRAKPKAGRNIIDSKS